MALSENKQRMARGELYWAFSGELIAERKRCLQARTRFNNTNHSATRRENVEMWRDLVADPTPLPPKLPNEEEDKAQFEDDPWVEVPLHMDYGYNVRVGKGSFVNANSTFVDTCTISIGARTLIGPHVSFYSGTHPLDPELRNGVQGPELGKEIHVGDDVWIGGNVIILPGIKVGRGATIGAGSVVTKDVPAFHIAAGNPAKVIRKIKTKMDPDQQDASSEDVEGAEKTMAS